MSNRRPLSDDLTDQGKYQLEHGRPVGHTPGPWSAFAGAVFTGPKSSPTFVARIDKGSSSIPEWDERDANQQLIAAAPDLLLALQAMLHQFEEHEQYADGGDESLHATDAAVIAMARAATAKAEGGAE